jgi:dihydroorotate dehydrogenase
MPSRDPSEWRPDVERARRGLRARQILTVSVVASPQTGWTMSQLADDFAQCAMWAADAGAQVVEANLSCPNVCTKEADLYLSPEAASEIASTIRARLPREVPLAVKIGLFQTEQQAAAVLRALAPFATAVSSTNSITATVRDQFGGLKRGIGGAATTARCLSELVMLSRLASGLELIGVGGVMNTRDVRDRLAAGAGKRASGDSPYARSTHWPSHRRELSL